MVYNKVYVIAGFVVDRKFVENIEYSELLHSYPCCSGLRGKTYILGRIVHIYYRKCLDGCGYDIGNGKKCGDLIMCDKCFGTCNDNKQFNIQEIFENVVKIDNSKVCSMCNNIIEEKFFNGLKLPSKCPVCDFSNKCDATPAVYDLKSHFNLDQTPGFYLMIDDCISCT